MVRRICTIVEKAETKQKHFTQQKQKLKKKKKKNSNRHQETNENSTKSIKITNR